MNNFFGKYTTLAAAGLLVGASAFAQQAANPNGNMSPQTGTDSGSASAMHSKASRSGDAKFAHDAAVGGMEEVELGKIAVQKGHSDQVKQFGQRMIDDHTKAGDELKSVASKSNITLPTELDAKAKANVDKFSAMAAGPAFDNAYMRDMVKDHIKDIADFQKEASGGTNMDLKNFASSTLPTLQDHLKMAKEDAAALGSMSKK